MGPYTGFVPIQGSYLAAQTADAGLAHNAEELGMIWVLVTDILDRSFLVVADEPRMSSRKRAATLKIEKQIQRKWTCSHLRFLTTSAFSLQNVWNYYLHIQIKPQVFRTQAV